MMILPSRSKLLSMSSAAESNELFLSALGSPVHSILPDPGICRVIFEIKLLNPSLFPEISSNIMGVLWAAVEI